MSLPANNSAPLLSVITALLLFWLPASPLLAAQIELQVLPDQIRQNESFRLVYTATGSVDEEPDFSVLTTDFEILSNSSSSSISVINGDYTRSKSWTLDLMARRKGNLVIPPVPFGADLSPAKAIAVSAASAPRPGSGQPAADIFIDTRIEPQSPYVQQQAVLKVKLYRAVNVSSASLTEPTAASGDIIIEKLGEDSSYPANHGGRRYLVVERNYALLPQSSGDIAIAPLQFDGQVATTRRFGFDPFGGGKRVRIQSEPISLKVKPIPPSFQGNHWLPAKNLTLTAEWSEAQPEFRVGEPVTRIIRISAEGLAASQLPEINLTLPTGVRSYRDQPLLQAEARGDGIIASREEKIALIPQQTGILRLPAITIHWWNTDADRPETATLPSVEIAVQPPLSSGTGNNLLTQPLEPALESAEVAVDEPGGKPAPVQPTASAPPSNLAWVFAALFALAWIVTTWLWLRARAQRQESGKAASSRQLLRELQAACRANDRQLAAKALLAWGRLRHAQQPPPSLEAFARKESGDLSAEITRLAKTLYSSGDTGWQGDALWSAVDQAGKPTGADSKQADSPLAPLNPG